MASPSLTSVLESTELFGDSGALDNNLPRGSSGARDHLESRVRFLLYILRYLCKRFNNSDERLMLAEYEISITARKAEYSLEESKQDRRISTLIFLSIADRIDLLTTNLLKTLTPEFFNQEELLSYVLSVKVKVPYGVAYKQHHILRPFRRGKEYQPHSLALYKFSPKYSYCYIQSGSSYFKKFKERLCILPRTASPKPAKKKEIVDFVIAKFKSELELRVIRIGGDGSGIDKIMLARCIYSDSRMKNLFPICAWVTLFGRDRPRDLLQGLLHSALEYFPSSETYRRSLDEMRVDQLYECLHKHLEDQRYFIVIDDLNLSGAWRNSTYQFPDKKNGSMILFLTDIEWPSFFTSETNLVLSRPGRGQILKMFHDLVFGKRSFPEELKIMYTSIVDSCEGSLYAVFMVAKYLSTINQTTDNWLIVQERLRNNASESRDLIINITSALLKASEDINLIHAEETSTYFENCEIKNKQPERFPNFKASSEVPEDKDHVQVGLEECLDVLLLELLRSSRQLEKLAIAGMAGIGKTTLAKRIFYDPSISSHFHIRAWIDISQFYQKRNLLIQLLQGVTKLTDNEILNETDAQLEEKVYRCLKGQRYLIIMDDVWDSKAWNELKRTFPDDNLGSRMLLTTRESNLIEGLNCKIHKMSLLTEERSWDLLQKKVFGQEICPQGLSDIGKQIAERCKGLPLAIIVVSGVLLKIDMTVDSWKVVAQSVSSHVMGSDNATRTIFSLSYKHLPDYLKSCFLYIGAFPGGYEIEVRRLIRLWIAEGFIASDYGKCLEDVAEEYLNDLIDRSLLFSGRRRSNGRLKTCRIHDLVLEFCIQEARTSKFLDVIKDFRLLDSEKAIDGHHRFSFQCHTFDDVHLTASKSQAGSAIFFRASSHLVPDILIHYFDFKLLRVLDLISWRFDNFPAEQVAKLLLLRYFSLTATFELPGILFKHEKLQTLIINGPWLINSKVPELPPEFWRSTSLRHLQLRMVNHLLSPEKSIDVKYLKFLQTLTNITVASCTHESFSSIPNIMKLGVCETREDLPVVGLWYSFFQSLVLLEHIHTLKISCYEHNRPLPLPSLDAFPKGLKKLTLRRSNLPWEAMALIGDLPNLEVLKLRNNAFRGPNWETRDGGFQNLKYLLIEETNLMYWELESYHFPRLEQLFLKSCEALEEIPTEIGDIPTLTQIKMENCCSSAERSAKDIQEQCNEYGHIIKIQILTQRKLSGVSL